jgi:RNA polymerase sigma factor (sigma-70 family)
LRLADFHACPVEELFPQAVLALKKAKIIVELNPSDIPNLLSDHQHLALMSPEELLMEKEKLEAGYRYLDKLTPEERMSLTREDKTLREVGESIGVSRERIRQLETQALGKVQKAVYLENKAEERRSSDKNLIFPT